MGFIKISFFEANKKFNPVPIAIGITEVNEELNFEVERKKTIYINPITKKGYSMSSLSVIIYVLLIVQCFRTTNNF
jgi:hypothetical protein